jgi:hypothetical protein
MVSQSISNSQSNQTLLFIIIGIILIFFIIIPWIKSNCNNSETFISSPNRISLSNKFSDLTVGRKQCLDIINDGENNRLIMNKCDNVSGQQWSTEYTNDGYRLQNDFTGPSKCLDIIYDGEKNKLIMSKCGDYSGQQWNFTTNDESPYYNLTLQNNFSGPKKCLDIINDGRNNQPIMYNCANSSGQQWNSIKIDTPVYDQQWHNNTTDKISDSNQKLLIKK